MFGLSQQVRGISQAINVLANDMSEVKMKIANQPSTSSFQGSAPANTVTVEDMQRSIASAIADCHTRISDVKRGVDAVKMDYTKEIALLESSLSRKIEANVNKMLNDKIAVALDAHQGVIKDIVAAELSVQPAADDVIDEDFEMSVTLATPVPPVPTAPAPVKRGRKVKSGGIDKDA